MNIRNIIDVLKSDVARTTTIMLWGPPGVGKSASVRQAAAELGIAQGSRPLPVVDLRLTQLDPTDLKGIPHPIPEGPGDQQALMCGWASPAQLPRAWRDGDEGFLLLDELNSAPQLVQAAAYELTLDRRLGDYRVPPGWRIVCAGNRRGDGGITFQMPTPLANRMLHLEATPELDAWKAWAYGHGISPTILSFLTTFPDHLLALDPLSADPAFPTPRSWELANRVLLDSALAEPIRDAMLAGAIGKAAASDFASHMRLESQLPDLEGILSGRVEPANVATPTSTAVQYLVVISLVSQIRRFGDPQKGRTAVSRAIEYVTRLPMEFMVLFIKDIQAQLPGSDRWITTDPAYHAWALKNSGLGRRKKRA